MTVRRTFAALATGLVLSAVPAAAMAGTRPHGMTPAAYRALAAQGRALNARYGNAVTRLSPSQFAELWRDGGSKMSPEALNALIVRSQAQNRAAAKMFYGLSPNAYYALVARGQALNARYGNAVTSLSPEQFIELFNDGGSKLTPEALNALVVRSKAMDRLAAAHASAPETVATTESSFAWEDFGIGMAAAFGLVLLTGGLAVAVRTGTRSRVGVTS